MLVLSFGLVTSLPVAAAAELIVGDPYSTIQAAVTAAEPGDTVIVYAGTYTEDVLIDKNLTLEGAQVGVDARGRTGDETELVGSFKVVSPAGDVTIDGFTITGTADGTMMGVCIRTECPDVAVVNNIINAVEAWGGYTYSEFVSLVGLTDALVECNYISGAYESDRAPNVVKLDVSGAGTVTAVNNELTEVGGGGGFAIVCTNGNATINILDNNINQCGDGMWAWSNPSFGTLTIAGNTFAHNNSCHGGACENTDTGVKLVGVADGAVIVEDNEFLDNHIQVDDSAGVLDVQEVLDSNIFDKAVVVDHPGGSLLHTIWSFIQDGVDAAATGDTALVLDGDYAEVVVVDEPGITVQGESLGVVVDGGFWLQADDACIDGMTILNGFARSGDYRYAILPMSPSGDVYPTSGHTIANSDIVGDGTGVKCAGIADGTDGSNNLSILGNSIHGWRIGIGLSGVSSGHQILGNDIYENLKTGIELSKISNTTIESNTIQDNTSYGINFMDAAGYGGANVVHYNNFCGNGVGLENDSGNPLLDAINNWWCHPSGPSHSPGYGDKVSGNVDYEPWWLAPGGPSYDKTLCLKDGWTLFSVDKAVIDPVVVGDVLLKYKYTGSTFVPATLTDLYPLTAIYVKTLGGGGVGLNYPAGAPDVYSKDLVAGWNLIGIPETEGATKDVLSTLRYATIGGQQAIGLTTLVSQPEYNLSGIDFYEATLTDGDWDELPDLDPFDGYWASMEAAKTFEAIP